MTEAASIDAKQSRDLGPRLCEAQMPAQHGRVPSLDGLRAVSIAVVLLSHFVSSSLFPGGLGVYVFFVISGFLIARLLLSEQKEAGRISLPKFYLRRARRLYPVMIAAVAAIWLFGLWAGRAPSVAETVSPLFYFSNFLYTDGQPHSAAFITTWSLAVEEHFYFVFPPLLLLCLAMRSKAALIVAMAAVCILCLALRVLVAGLHPELIATRYFYYRSQFRLDSMAYGVLIAAACETARGRRLLLALARPRMAALAVATIGACLVVRDPWFRETVRYTLLGCAIAVLVAFVLFRSGWASLILNHPAIAWVGRLSYSLYLWHTLGADLTAQTGLSGPAKPLAAVTAAFALAVLSFYGLERPLRRPSPPPSNPIDAVIGRNLRQARSVAQFPRGRLARELGISRLELARIETGRRMLAPGEMCYALRALNTTVAELFHGLDAVEA